MSIDNWFEEKQSAWLYRIVTRAERDPKKSALFAELADAAESQARIWERRITETGGVLPEFQPTLRARLVSRLLPWFGPRALRPMLAAMKVRGLSVYQGGTLPGGHVMPTSVTEVGHRHKGVESGGNLRASVFGLNDGLVSNTSLIMGVVGAAQDFKVVMLTGIAGLLAGAFSMAAGEYVSMRSQRELFEYQIALEREELEEYPVEEQEELALIYAARGLSKEQAQAVAEEIMKDREQALDALAREELGLNPEELGSPWGAAWSSFVSFAVGGLIPLLPFFFTSGPALFPAVLGITAIALFTVGASLSLFTGRKALWSGLRMMLIGGGAGGATYFIGALLGASLI